MQNRQPIIEVIKPLLRGCKELLEIGSGTGQHAAYFAPELPQLNWQTSDQSQYHPGIQMWLDEAGLPNVKPPLKLDVLQADWPALQPDAVFTANTLHIMSPQMVEACIAGVGQILQTGGLFMVYGPFNYHGEYTSESNARFDQWLAQQNPDSAIRDFVWVNELVEDAGMVLQDDVAMPANNRILVWRKQSG